MGEGVKALFFHQACRVLAGISGKRKSTPREYARASCTVSRVVNAKRIGNDFTSSSAIFGTQNSRAFRE